MFPCLPLDKEDQGSANIFIDLTWGLCKPTIMGPKIHESESPSLLQKRPFALPFHQARGCSSYIQELLVANNQESLVNMSSQLKNSIFKIFVKKVRFQHFILSWIELRVCVYMYINGKYRL